MKGLLHFYFDLCFLLLFSFHFHVDSSLSLNSSTPTKLCPRDQSFALIQFKNSLSVDCFASEFSCLEYKEKTISWKDGTNCCLWDGVKCESETGNVIGLDLRCSCLGGTIPSNSTLFRLQHLRHLNLGHNDLTGIIPPQISLLSKLVSLDLSINGNLNFEGNVFGKVLGNLTQLHHLFLDDVNMSSVVPTSFLNMSSSITTLSLKANGLQGKFPVDVFRFPCLQKLRLIDNYYLEVNFPKFNWSAPLRSLQLSGLFSSGELLDSIGNLRFLEVLNLSSSNLKGSIPAALGNLRSLQVLDLSSNFQLKGSIPATLGNLTRLNYLDLGWNSINGPILFPFSNFKELSHLDLSSCDLKGSIPASFGNLTRLNYLYLSSCHLNGSIPASLGNLIQLFHLSLGNNQLSGPLPFSAIFNLAQLEFLDFSSNKLEGPLPPHVSGLSRLRELYLDSNSLSGKIPSWLFSLPSLVALDLSNNKLTGPIEQFGKIAPLERLDLGNNEMNGPIPISFSKLVNLTYLDLSSTKLNGNCDLSNFSKLEFLSLSNTAVVLSMTSRSNGNYSFPNLRSLNLSSCNLSEFSDVVRNLPGLSFLDLSYNRIRMIEADMFLKLESLIYLDLSNNSPLTVSNKSNVSLVLPYLAELHLSSCSISKVPIFFTSQDSLMDLDLSNNLIQGKISEGKTEWGKNLVSVNLEKNFLTVVVYYH
ncbi:hypothetical protein PTKIN_Ptkin14bG0178700 [Pterospermum kingtungense]